MSGDVLRRALTVLLCGRTVRKESLQSVREESLHRSAESLSVVGVVPLPAVSISRLSAPMQSHYQSADFVYQPSEEQALSIALAQSVADQAAWQAARASGSSQAHQVALKRSAGEALSKKLWQDGSLGYDDVITDGFYEVYGDFPEVCEGPHEFPSLENLRKVRTGSGDVREVVVVDHELDPGLLQAEEMLSEAMAESNPQDAIARIRVVAHVVCDRFGGTYDSEAVLERFWQVSSAAEKRRNRSVVLLLCRLDVGGLRHRALLFKVLADAVKLPCKLLRGQALCGADSAANVMVLAEGREHIVDLVFDPGRLIPQDQFASLVQIRTLYAGQDNWQNPGNTSISAATAGSGIGVETSGVSVSSTSSAGTHAGTAGFTTTTSTSSNHMQQGPVSSSAASLAPGSQPAPVATGTNGISIAPPVSMVADVLPAPHSSPRATPSRSNMFMPPVPVSGPYSGPQPVAGAGLQGQVGTWGLGPGYVHGNGPGPAIAGSRVRFTITDLPKTGNPQPHGTRGELRNAPPAVPRPAPGIGPTPSPLPAPPGDSAATASGGSGQAALGVTARHSMSSLPGKAKSMVDLAATTQNGGDGQASASAPGFDLIRLDSEPLPDSLHEAVPPPERTGTPTGTSAPGPRGSSALLNRRQNSFDQNGWVKFSGSFTRSKEDAKPWAHGAPLGLSPLSQLSEERTAAASGTLHGSISGSTAPPTPQTVGTVHGLELSNSLQGMGTAVPSPDGTRTGSSIGSTPNIAGNAGPSAGSSVVPVAQGTPFSKVTTASAFAHFQFPSDLSAAAFGDPAAAGNTGGSGGGLSGRASHGGSENSLPKIGVQPQHHSGPQLLPSQPPQPSLQPALPSPPPNQPRSSATSPFQAMQMGFGSHMPPASLVSAFGGVPPPLQQQPMPGTIHAQAPTHIQQQQQQQGHRPPQAPAAGCGAGGSLSAVNLPLPRMSSVPYTGQPKAPSPPQVAQQPLPGQPVRQYAAISHDSMHRMYGLGNGAAAAAGGTGFFTPPPKSTDGVCNTGSKAPSPVLSTPFTAATASSAHSTAPGSAPADSVPFADLSPFNFGEAAASCGSGRKDDKPERDREQREWEQREWGRERGRGRERDRAQSFFADLSPFNTSSGAGGSGETRDGTPARRNTSSASPQQQQQPNVEFPSSDNSRETTPRVSVTNLNDAQGPPNSRGGVVEGVAFDLSRMQLGVLAGGRQEPNDGQLGSMHQRQLQIQQTFGPMSAMAPAAIGAHSAHQVPNHLAMAYFASVMQGNPYVYVQSPATIVAGTAAMLPQAQNYLQGQSAAVGQGVQGWRQVFDHAWANSWAAAQQPNQYMLHTAYMQQQQQQQQQEQQRQQQAMMAAAAGMAGQVQPGQALGLPGPGLSVRLHSSSTTTSMHVVEPVASTSGRSQPPAGSGVLPARALIASVAPQLALPPSTQPQLPQPLSQPQVQQQQALQPQPQQPPQPPQQVADLAHEMTLPSARRMERLQVPSVANPDAGAGAGLASPLGLQPSLSGSMPLPPSYRDFEINPDELTFKNRVGIGSYGEVYRGTWRGTEVAIKRFLEQNLSQVTIKEFRGEVMIMSKLRHPNIVLFMGAVTQSNQLAIVTQFMARGSLFRMLHRTKEVLDPRRRLNMALDIAKGMEYLHNCKPVLVHRDLKSPNLLVDKDYTIKVCDFGLSQVKMNTFLTAKSQGGSPAWMAPEILRGEPCDEKSDVFSFGVILYELVTGKEPWEDLNPMQVVGAVGFSGRRMSLPTELDPAVTELINRCWVTSPKERPSFSQILATMTAWSELRPTAAVMQQQQEAAKARQQRAAAS
ncbi:hypothetical protein Vretimale_15526 [Volvox reticuliferus]|uniref:non-specific serine/threonine protein kinase n=1 Tax=Volvox reticuliferus TaxID=1737510 RepID=A0A8J4CUB4_9CHLO|nr:hypothetical protein Vretifemale_15143 [Volvox reticuliferus]GIM12097.1 hypothetical protein Vretimale_15526 [Volvox reticuliferus]